MHNHNGDLVCVPKLLLEISIRELHNNLIKSAKEGGLPEARHPKMDAMIISDLALHYVLPLKIHKLTARHKQL